MSETSGKQHLTAEVVEQSSVTVPTRLKNDRRAVVATLVPKLKLDTPAYPYLLGRHEELADRPVRDDALGAADN